MFIRGRTPDLIVPLINNRPIAASNIPSLRIKKDEWTRLHQMRTTHEGSLVCYTLVKLLEDTHRQLPEPLLVFRTKEKDLLKSLAHYNGKDMELVFTSFKVRIPVKITTS